MRVSFMGSTVYKDVDAVRGSSVKCHIWVFIDLFKVGRKYAEVFIGFGQSYKGTHFHQHVHTHTHTHRELAR